MQVTEDYPFKNYLIANIRILSVIHRLDEILIENFTRFINPLSPLADKKSI